MALDNEVKLVIWDLDDTFWKGTLSEEAIEPIPRNIALVRVLAQRGIISSISSRNDPGEAEKQLTTLGIWDYFVLPSIGFHSKGASISQQIDAMQLRAVNVVFIDDNPSVLAEAAFSCPGLQVLSSPAELDANLDGAQLQGKPDPELVRLRQYRALATRFDQRQMQAGDDASFLRQSEIRLEIDYTVENHIDRIIELINRSNQLNYTKLRITGQDDRADFIASLSRFGFKPGVVRVWDRYADYGIVGFFMTEATLHEYKLHHFVFSCRVMNMGIEQYIYDYLGRPAISIAYPVANSLDAYARIDWIEVGSASDIVEQLRELNLVLIGGCDMLQLSTYCSSRSVEFTNRDFRGIIKRLDDPFLILDNPEAVKNSSLRPHVPAFTHAEMIELRVAVAQADAVIVSFYRMMEINYFRGRDGLFVRFDEDAVKQMLASDQALWFIRNFAFVELTHEQRQELIRRSLAQLTHMAKADARVIVILENTRKLEDNPDEKYLRELYNEFIIKQSETNKNLAFVDINTVTNINWLFDDGFHMSRQGYYELAEAVKVLMM